MKQGQNRLPDVKFLVKRSFRALILAASLAGGMLYAAALPPLNWNFAVFISLLPLLYCAVFFRWRFRMLCGWIWGLGWSLFAYNFLREIHPAVPYMLAPVISLWPAVFMLLCGFFSGKIIKRSELDSPWQLDIPPVKALCFLALAAVLFTVIEWTRYYLFVWNDLSVTMWKLPVFMQIARLTGRYGVSLMITSVNAALFALIFCHRKRWMPAAVLMIFPVISLVYGIYRMNSTDELKDKTVWKCALIQGNLPQQRVASEAEICRSIEIYTSLSKQVLSPDVQTVIWPECAIPIPIRSNHPCAAFFRKSVLSLNRQILLGSLDFDIHGNMTNSALLISKSGKFDGKYDKYHRVPFGEYVPFRSLLPESWIEAFDMGRDLTGGKFIEPLPVSENIRVGTAVCYEGVFSYMSAAFARNGANVLAAISNDVWYPESSEPEQHLANAVMRCVETGLPMIRCGNNGGSGVVTSKGVFTRYIGSSVRRPELLREQAAGTVTVELERCPEPTFAVRFEHLFSGILLVGTIAAAIIITTRKNTAQ